MAGKVSPIKGNGINNPVHKRWIIGQRDIRMGPCVKFSSGKRLNMRRTSINSTASPGPSDVSRHYGLGKSIRNNRSFHINAGCRCSG